MILIDFGNIGNIQYWQYEQENGDVTFQDIYQKM